jgi:hypothetical protein
MNEYSVSYRKSVTFTDDATAILKIHSSEEIVFDIRGTEFFSSVEYLLRRLTENPVCWSWFNPGDTKWYPLVDTSSKIEECYQSYLLERITR